MAPRNVVSTMLRCWCAEPKGRALLMAWAATFTGVTVRAVYLRRRAKRLAKLSGEATKPAAAGQPKAQSPLRKVQRLAIPRWGSQPVVWFGVLSTGIGLRLLVQIKTSTEIGALGSLLAKGDWPALYRRQLTYALYAVPAAFFAALQKYAAHNVALAMRANLTAVLHERYATVASLPAALASVEEVAGGDEGVQRGMADLEAYCSNSVALFEGFFKPSVEVILISGKLAMMMGPTQLLSVAGFFGLAGGWTRSVAPAFATLASDVQAAGATLLSHRTRLHTHAEEVTMLRGAAAEKALMDTSAKEYHRSAAQQALQRFGSDVLDTYVLRYVGILAAFSAMMPAIIASTPLDEAAADPTKYFLTCLHLLVQVGMALKDLVMSFKTLATTRGLATRVHGLLAALDTAAIDTNLALAQGGLTANSTMAASPGGTPLLLTLQAVTLQTPDGVPLVHDLAFSIAAGHRLLITGPNGSGKSSLVRVLSGAWPLAEDCGEVTWSIAADERLVVPQRPYVLPQLSLRSNLLYPETVDGGRAAKEYLDVLDRVGLRSKLAPAGEADLDTTGPCDGLSPGEKQRLGLARILLRRPALALLDEACASVEPEFEAAFFAECAASGMSLLTVSHRKELEQFHTHELRLDGHGHATFRALPDMPPADGSVVLVQASDL